MENNKNSNSTTYNKNYFKNLLVYIKVSNLFIIGFYKSVIHIIYPYWYKEDINNIVIKLQTILLKKKHNLY